MADDLEKIEKLKREISQMADKIDMLVDMGVDDKRKFVEDLRKNYAEESQPLITNFVILVTLIGLIISLLGT